MRLTIIAALGALLASGAVIAQSARKDSGNNTQLMQQMQQLASERTSLQAENARLKRELDEIRKERDSAKRELESTDQKLRGAQGAAVRASGDRQQLESDLAQYKDRLTELVAKFRETVTTLREVETEHTTTRQQLDVRTLELKSCVDRNVQLFTMNQEILDHLERQGVFSSLARAEPFTRIKRTQLENLADDYRARAEEARIEGSATPPPAVAAPAPGPNPGG